VGIVKSSQPHSTSNYRKQGPLVVVSEPSITQREKLVQLLLRLIGLIVLTALIPMVFPASWIRSLHQLAGLGDFPEEPISWYFARSLSLMYFVHGAIVFALSTDVRRYWPLIRMLGWLNLAIGTCILLIDFNSGMPLWWTALEGPSIFGGGCVLLWLMPFGPKSQEQATSN
jgi:hypothetical protein